MAINKIIYGGNTLIDLTGDTVSTSNLLYGETAHDRTGAIITGACSYDSDTTDANAMQSEILNGRTAYVNKNKITGNMVNNGGVTGTISTKAGQYTIPIGFHDGSGKVSIDSTEQAKIIAGNIKNGVTILGVEGTYTGRTINVEANKNVTPATTQQVITPSSGYDYLAQVTVGAIPYTETQNEHGTTVTIAGA
jgi:hypothetical protein